MATKPSYNGAFLLLHLNENDGFVDKSPGRRQITTNGDIIMNPFDGPFDGTDGFPLGCAEWPAEPTPGGTLADNYITVAAQDLLSWQDQHFTIEFWCKIPELPDDTWRMELTNMGNLNNDDPTWSLALWKQYGENGYFFRFRWEDSNKVGKYMDLPFSPDVLRIQEWEHFAFSYSPLSQAFDYWINGVSKGPFPGVASPGSGPWSGVNILQDNDATNTLTIGGVHPGDRSSNSNDTTPDTFKGLMAEYRLMSGQSLYPLGPGFHSPGSTLWRLSAIRRRRY